MRLYKQKGSKFWTYEFQFAGERYRASTRTTVKKLAGERMRARHREVEDSHGGYKRRESPKLFPAAADEYLSAKRAKWSKAMMRMERRSVEHLVPSFKKKFVTEISIGDIQKYIELKLAEGCSPRGVNMKLHTLRAILRRNHCWERLRPDFSMLRVDETVGRALTPTEEDQLLAPCRASMSRLLFPAVSIALNTGMRHDEIRLLRWNQVHLEKAFLNVGRSKTPTGTGRMVPLNQNALVALTDWANKFPDRRPEHFVLPTERYSFSKARRTVKIYDQDPLKPVGSWKTALNTAFRKVGFKVRFHDLRHTAVTRMLESGVPLETVAALLGWSASTRHSMSKRYCHITDTAMRAAVAKLDRNTTSEELDPNVAEYTSITKGKTIKKATTRKRRADEKAA
jgi:integrase